MAVSSSGKYEGAVRIQSEKNAAVGDIDGKVNDGDDDKQKRDVI